MTSDLQPTGPVITHPDELPVSARREDLAAALRDHQVVVVAGETGSGKTTQLPKICLALGRGADGQMIGHTQPRRMAARNVATRISDELAADGLGTGLGDLVGYQVRFTDETSAATRLKLMTDGILLAELQRDRELRRYDTIIIDEAHERSLNIDFLLGYLKQLLPRRPDLRVIITSATIDPDRFARHFALDPGTGRASTATAEAGAPRGAEDPVPAPVVEVSGRTHPVEVRYRPLAGPGAGDGAAGPGSAEGADGEDDDATAEAPPEEAGQRDQTDAIVDAVRELSAEGPGDILVFLPGEREIRDTADALTEALGRDARDPRSPRHVEVLPLYSRLPAAEQQRVFDPTGTHRRVVLATNVAETSLTVPGIRYVIDTGLARISRYSVRTKVQRLPVEPISQASADQRAGRCGRVAPGIAIRLYAEEDYLARPEFTDPEIRRTNLASVILQMATLGLGDVARFPFVEPPDNKQVRAGRQLLEEIGAMSSGKRGPRVTKLGRRVARLPVDPRLARMILEAERRGVVREVLVVVAALSVQDPRERPAEEQTQADQAHARFRDPTSDFLTLLNLWDHLTERQRALGSSQFRKLCRREYLNYLRVREWQDLESQLRQVCREMQVRLGPRRGDAAVDSDGVHQSLLSGLLSQIGALEEREERGPGRGRKGRRPGPREYAGARGTRFAIHPGSALKGQNPSFVMSAELVETTRLWARENAAIDPAWAEKLGAHLVKRSHAEPHWSARRGAVVAYEKVTLLGVPLVADRLVTYHKVDPALCRELFIRHALVDGDWAPEHADHHPFFAENRRLLAEAEELEHRTRRRDLVVDEQTLFDFYDARIGEEVVSSAHFDTWWSRVRREDPDLLTFDPAMLTRDDAAPERAEEEFPTTWQSGGLTFPISYHFEPGAADDGLTIDLPVSTLNQVDPGQFSWVVPGLREELVTALLRSLPKQLRTACVPAPDTAAEFLDQVPAGSEPLLDALERYLRASRGIHVPREAWDLTRVPEHLRPRFRVLDEHQQPVATGKDLAALQQPLAADVDEAVQQTADEAGATATGETSWTFGELPPAFTRTRAGQEVRGYPALVDEGRTVGLAVLPEETQQQAEHRDGLRRLVALALDQRDEGEPQRRVRESLGNTEKLALSASPYTGVTALLDDCRLALAGEAVDAALAAGDPVRDEAAFERVVAAARQDHEARLRSVLADVLRTLEQYREADRAVSGRADMATLPALTDMQAQLAALVHDGFVAEAGTGTPGAGTGWLRRLPVYLQALQHRKERLAEDPARDRELVSRFDGVRAAWQHRVDAVGEGRAVPLSLRRVRWLLEEYRVSLWAQHLGTAVRVSDARIREELEGR